MTILLLPPEHELVAETPDAMEAAFATDRRHPGETAKVLAILDEHWSTGMRTEIVPADPEVQEWVPKVARQIRESTILDVFEAVSEKLIESGYVRTEAGASMFLEAVRAIVDQPKIPTGWLAWGQIPRGSLSAAGDGSWYLIWPKGDARGRDMAVVSSHSVTVTCDAAVRGPEFVYNPSRPSVPFVRLILSGLSTEQIESFLADETGPEDEAPPATFRRLFGLGEAA